MTKAEKKRIIARCPLHKETFFFGEDDEDFLYVHQKDECSGEYCVIHKPSNHSMRDFPLRWRGMRGFFERLSENGTGHPDPDSMLHIYETRGLEVMQSEMKHGCQGGCNGAYDGLYEIIHKKMAR